METHKHMCGHTDPFAIIFSDSPRSITGCGHVWEHPDPPGGTFETKEQWKELHTCPACGGGPWTLKYYGVKCDEYGNGYREHRFAGDRILAEKKAQQQIQESKGGGTGLEG